MTLRRYLTAQYDWTGLSSKIYRSKAWEIGALLFAGALVLLLVAFYHLQVVGMQLSEFTTEPMGMEHMFGKIAIFIRIVFFISYFFLLSNAFRMYWFTMHRGTEVKIPFLLYLSELRTFILHGLTQKRFRDCTEKDKSHWVKHWFLIPAFVLMFMILVFFLDWFQTDNIYPIYHPQRWLGYFVACVFFFAAVGTLIGRFKKRKQLHKFSTHTDWTFPILLLLTTVSGAAVHIFRYLGLSLVTHYTYALHLAIAVPMLVIELPFGKWTHMIYRPLAIYLQTVKEKALQQQQLPEEAVLDHAR